MDNKIAKTIICKDCGQEFKFYSKSSKENSDASANFLAKRESYQKSVNDLIVNGRIPESQELQAAINMLEYVVATDNNSQEANYFEHEPARCPECRRKIQEGRVFRFR